MDFETKELYALAIRSKLLNDEIPYNIDKVWEEISNRYYMSTGIKTTDEDALFEWLKETERYNLLDSFMLKTYDRFINKEEYIDNTDKFFIANLYKMRDIVKEQIKNTVDGYVSHDNITATKVSKKETINYVKDILLEVDPTGEWEEIYNDLRKDKKILYLNELTEKQVKVLESMLGFEITEDSINSCINIGNESKFVMLTYTGTISDIACTIHEVIHYISRYKNGNRLESPTLREFNSIFYELYATEYLKKNGFNKDEVDAMKFEIRTYETYQMALVVEDILDYLIMLVENNEIKEEYEIDSVNKYRKCDECTIDLVDDPYVLFEYYPYIIGSYLAEIALKKIKEDKFLPTMLKFATDKLVNMDPYDVFTLLDCNHNDLVRRDESLIFNDAKKKNKIKE